MLVVQLTRIETHNPEALRTNQVTGVAMSSPILGAPYTVLSEPLTAGLNELKRGLIRRVDTSVVQELREVAHREWFFKTANSAYSLRLLTYLEPMQGQHRLEEYLTQWIEMGKPGLNASDGGKDF